MSSPVYVPTDRLRNTANKIAVLEPNAVTGKIEPDDVLIALAEHGDIWPLSIALDAALNGNR